MLHATTVVVVAAVAASFSSSSVASNLNEIVTTPPTATFWKISLMLAPSSTVALFLLSVSSSDPLSVFEAIVRVYSTLIGYLRSMNL